MKKYQLIAIIMLLTGCFAPGEKQLHELGVSGELAAARKGMLGSVEYRLKFTIPSDSREEIPGGSVINFMALKKSRKPLLIDFNAEDDYLREVTVNGLSLPAEITEGNIIIPGKMIIKGANTIELGFRTGEISLNRNPDFLYTLLVPDRASTTFPCFDQPDIKAIFHLTLDLPEDYEAISNSTADSVITVNGRKKIIYKGTRPISTYLFAFAAGRFDRVESEIDGVKMEMLHREPDVDIVERNLEEIFRLHYNAIRWMEEYTGIPYPFGKFGFVLIPSFQYGGMEHPGSIFYRASSLFLEESPSINDRMSRASLIAHETSHIWFGDLVTMKWFDDVWLKEVFAGYMSDKIVNPDFPEANHDLRFLLSRYPAAYAVDRTRGTNPVIQELDNLRNAGSLYGGIIYNKAPIIMKHLEQITGEDGLRQSLRVYLKRFSYDNAEWDDLISIIGEVTGKELRKWSEAWVREPGMPHIESRVEKQSDGFRIWFDETDPTGRNRHWPQTLNALAITNSGNITGKCVPGEKTDYLHAGSAPLCIIPDTSALAYGYFLLDRPTIDYLAGNERRITNPLIRGFIWINAWENLLDRRIDAGLFYNAMLREALTEEDEQLRNYLSGRLHVVFWSILTETGRKLNAAGSEIAIWDKVLNVTDPARRRLWYNLYRNIASTPAALDTLYQSWQSATIEGTQKLSEDELCTLALTLALKRHPESKKILETQYDRITSTDRRSRFEFVMPSVSDDQEVRDSFFRSLSDPTNREREPWVLEALGYLHHPLIAANSVKYLGESLEMLEEIKYNGDIFFPGNWISTILSGHTSEDAFTIVEGFLEANPDYPEDLKLKILQASDNLYRLYSKK
jgi:aminopeptidase N